jgi:deazaflavin-dependent oxidoreductase (nitroreductase family)
MAAAFDSQTYETAARTKEIELTTYGRKTGKPSRRIMWITAMNGRIYVRSGPGMNRDWPKNLVANGRGILHMDGKDLPVRARHVTDAQEARAMHAPVKAKYNAERPSSTGNEPLTAAEEAVFELTPEDGQG